MLRRLWNVLRSRRLRRDIEREVAFHLAERADQLRAEGLGDDEAMRRARLQFGNVALQVERTRDMDVALWADALVRNMRFATRALVRTSGFTVSVVLMLGLGIGANAAVFSAIHAVLLRALPFPDADRLVQLRQMQEASAESYIAPVRLEDWHRSSSTFEAISGYFVGDSSETSGDLPERVRRAFVAPRFLETWGVAPALGRDFTADEYRFGGPPAVLISDRYWRRRFDAAEDVLERKVRVGSSAIPIVGVMPASFLFPDREVDLWLPSPVDAPYAQSRRNTWFNGIARLRSGATLEQARADLGAVQLRLGEQYPETDREIGVAVTPLEDVVVGRARSSLWLLYGAVSVLLLTTCTNVAGLLVARGTHQQQAIAVRLSLGASRPAVAAQIVAEAGLLAVTGGALGLLLAVAATAALRSAAPDLPRIDEIAIDGTILLYCLGASACVALLCGLLPVVRTSRYGIAAVTREAGRAVVSTRNSLQWLLVCVQVTLSVTLLAGAGLLVRSFQELSQVAPGFEPARILTFRLSGDWSETTDYERLRQRIDGTIDVLRDIPGIEAAATSGWSLPGVPEEWQATFELAEARHPSERRIVAEARSVSPEYFQTMHIPIVAGELCRRRASRSDGASEPAELLVNRVFANRYVPAGFSSIVGLHLGAIDSRQPPGRIVGIVGDAREQGLDRAPQPTVYWCDSTPNPTPFFLMRTRGEPMAVASAVRLRMKEIEPLRAVYDIAPLDQRIGEAFSDNRLRTVVVSFFAITALALASVGVYGMLSYVVSARSREIGLRLALGAARLDILRQVVGRGLVLAIVACACGLALSSALTRFLTGMLYGVTPADPATLAGVVAVVLAVAAFASLVPAARAALVEPMRVLREG